MISKVELLSAIEELLQGKHTIQNCERLASVYTVLDHLYPDDIEKGYSFDDNSNKNEVIGDYGNSEFLKLIRNQDLNKVIPLVDELVSTVQVLNPRLYAGFIRNIENSSLI